MIYNLLNIYFLQYKSTGEVSRRSAERALWSRRFRLTDTQPNSADSTDTRTYNNELIFNDLKFSCI